MYTSNIVPEVHLSVLEYPQPCCWSTPPPTSGQDLVIWSPTPPWPPTSGQQPPPTSGLRQAFRPNPVPCLCRPQHFVLRKMPKQHPQRENRGILDFQTKCPNNTHNREQRYPWFPEGEILYDVYWTLGFIEPNENNRHKNAVKPTLKNWWCDAFQERSRPSFRKMNHKPLSLKSFAIPQYLCIWIDAV